MQTLDSCASVFQTLEAYTEIRGKWFDVVRY